VDVQRYARDHRRDGDCFPHQSTADQFFDETQFERYRMLGEHMANLVMHELNDLRTFDPDVIKSAYPHAFLAQEAMKQSVLRTANGTTLPNVPADEKTGTSGIGGTASNIMRPGTVSGVGKFVRCCPRDGETLRRTWDVLKVSLTHAGVLRALGRGGGFCSETKSLVARCDDFFAYSPIPSDTPDIGHEEARLPGMFAPMYHESARGKSVRLAASCTWSTHLSSASGSGSISSKPCSRPHSLSYLVWPITAELALSQKGHLLRSSHQVWSH
jgi:hypothetical protein